MTIGESPYDKKAPRKRRRGPRTPTPGSGGPDELPFRQPDQQFAAGFSTLTYGQVL